MIDSKNPGVELFDKPQDEKPLISDLEFWCDVYQVTTSAEEAYATQMYKVVSMIDGRCKQFFTEETDRRRKGFVSFMADVNSFRTEILDKANRASVDSEQFQKDVYAFKNFNEDNIVKLDAKLHGKHYQEMKSVFLKDRAVLEARLQKFHVLSMEHEKTELEMLATHNEEKFMEFDKKFIELQNKVKKAETKYRIALLRTLDKHEELVTASMQFEESWRTREVEKADWLCKIMYQSNKRRQKQNNQTKVSHFHGIDTDQIVGELGVSWFVPDIQFQAFKRERIYKIKETLYTITHEAVPDVGEGKIFGTIDDCLIEKVYAYRDFKKLYPWQLSLRQGYALKQLLPANEGGFAFGEYVNDKGKRFRGFYPADHVSNRMPDESMYFHGDTKAEKKKYQLTREMQDILNSERNRDNSGARELRAPQKKKMYTSGVKSKSDTATGDKPKSAKKVDNSSTSRKKTSTEHTKADKDKKKKGKTSEFVVLTKEDWVDEKKKAAEALRKVKAVGSRTGPVITVKETGFTLPARFNTPSAFKLGGLGTEQKGVNPPVH